MYAHTVFFEIRQDSIEKQYHRPRSDLAHPRAVALMTRACVEQQHRWSCSLSPYITESHSQQNVFGHLSCVHRLWKALALLGSQHGRSSVGDTEMYFAYVCLNNPTGTSHLQKHNYEESDQQQCFCQDSKGSLK